MTTTTNGSAALAIQTRELSKTFGERVAVRGLSLDVPRGEIFGFLGPNGAGKSTSIKMMLGLVRPTGGDASVLGGRPRDPETRRRVGFLPEDFRFYDWLTAAELIRLHGRLCGMSDEALRQRVPAVLERVGLGGHMDQRVRGFSKGMMQRAGLAQAIVHEPDLVFLDEPTSGLDPMGRRMVRDILREERERGATVFLNSHLLSEVEVTCDRVVFIKHGEVVASKRLGGVADATRLVVLARNVSDDAVRGASRWAAAPVRESDRLTFQVPSPNDVPAIVRHLVSTGADVYGVSQMEPTLEDLFVEVTGGEGGL